MEHKHIDLVLEGLFGQVEKSNNTKELMERNSCRIRIRMYCLKHSEEEVKVIVTYADEINYLVHSQIEISLLKLCAVVLKVTHSVFFS